MTADIQNVVALMTSGQWQEAHHVVNEVLEREPTLAQGWHLRGILCSRLGDAATAISCFNQALQYKPDFRDAALSLGRMLEKTGQAALAIRVFEHLLTIDRTSGEKKPSAPAGDIKAARKLFHHGEECQKRGDAKGAVEAFRQVLALAPDMPEALINLGVAHYSLRQHSEAEKVLLQCLRVSPDNVHALNTLAGTYAVGGESLRAIAVWRYMIAKYPNHYEALVNLAKALSGLEFYAEAAQAYEAALKLRPDLAELWLELVHMLCRLCRWERAGAAMAVLEAILTKEPQWMEQFLVTVHLPQLQLQNAKLYVRRFYPAGVAYDASRPLPADARGDGKLRIGYISSDFHPHATAWLISELFELHDKERFDIIAYSYGKADASPERRRIANAVSQFRDIRMMDDPTVAGMIRQDGIDILVDLKGYTAGSRLGLMASRPAPLQMHYLGHPGTTGASFIDYFIADSVAAPEGEDAHFSEALIRLPHCYQINDRKRPLPDKAMSRKHYGLPQEAFVFCDFNNAYKITPQMFALWLRLLQAVPGSVLWLCETQAEATKNMRGMAAAQDIDPARIVPAGNAPLAQHLARYLLADLALDTLPYNGHTTTSDALWCGVPVVTLMGGHFVSRVAASLLHAVGLPELVTASAEEYEALALALAQDRDRRERIRAHLQQGRMRFPLFDSVATARAIESAYLQAAERHRAGKAPAAFNVSAA